MLNRPLISLSSFYFVTKLNPIPANCVQYMLFMMDGRRRHLCRRIMPDDLQLWALPCRISSQLAGVANVTYPGVYQTFLDSIDVLNFDLS